MSILDKYRDEMHSGRMVVKLFALLEKLEPNIIRKCHLNIKSINEYVSRRNVSK